MRLTTRPGNSVRRKHHREPSCLHRHLDHASRYHLPHGAGSATQLEATATVPGTFAYDPVIGTVLTAGTHTLSVTFTPTDTVRDYDPSTECRSVSITVSKATPTVTWAAPAGITYGTALSAAQLNATGSVPGVLTYTPAAGTVLTAGTQTLSVTLSPNDGTDYRAVTKTVSIVVGQATTTGTWTTPAAITYGTALGAAQLDATASSPRHVCLQSRRRHGTRSRSAHAWRDIYAHRH